jgi:DNA polymerase-1
MQDVETQPVVRPIDYGLKKSPRYYAMNTNYIESLDSAQAMLDFALQRPLSHIGFDTEFRYDRPGVAIDKRNTAHDPKSIRPLLLSLAMAEPLYDGEGCLYSFVIDLRKPKLLPILKELFRIPVCFSGHFAKVELFCLWQLGLPEPNILWDTFIFEKLLHLGRHHHKYKLRKSADAFEQIQAKEEAKEKEVFGLSLVVTCQRYEVAYRMEAEKERLQQSFLVHSDEAPFSEEQIDYAAEDAIAASLLYPLQIQKAVQNDLLHHCKALEMAWVITNARIEWTGVRVDERRRDEAIARISVHQGRLEKYIAAEYGIQNTQSHKQLMNFFQHRGIINKFLQGGKVSFDKKTLEKKCRPASGNCPFAGIEKGLRPPGGQISVTGFCR